MTGPPSESSSNTVIYISFGSWLSAEHLPSRAQSIFENVVRRLVEDSEGEGGGSQVKVIFKRGKTEQENQDGEISVLERMENVMVKKW